jgi:hypothetical protein
MGKVERANRTIINIVRTMFIDTKLPQALWPELAKIAVYLRNRLLTKTLPQTPYETLWKRKPDLSYLRIIGSMMYAYNTQLIAEIERRRKLNPRVRKGRLVGYGKNIHQYRMWNPAINNVEEVALCRIDETDTQVLRGEFDFAGFNPDEFFTRDPDYELSESESEYEEYSSEHHEAPNQKRIEVVILKKRIAKRLYKELPNLTNQIIEGECSTNLLLALEEMKPEQIPGTESIIYHDAIISHEVSQWLEAMEDEFQSLIQLKTWSLVKLPKNRKAIKIKWVFKYKLILIPETDQIFIKYKARLVAKGFM